MPLLFCFWFSKRSLQLLGRPRFCSVNQLASHSLPLYRHVGVCFLSISYHLSMCYSLPLSLSLSLSLWVSLFYVFILTFVGLRGGGMKINMDVQSDVFILKWSFSAALPLLCNASDFPCWHGPHMDSSRPFPVVGANGEMPASLLQDQVIPSEGVRDCRSLFCTRSSGSSVNLCLACVFLLPPALSCRVSARVLCAILTCISYLFWGGTIHPFLYHWAHLSSVIPRGLDLTTANGCWDVDSHTKDFSLKAKGR